MKTIKTFNEFTEHVNKIEYQDNSIVLYRGQSDNIPLLPSIARKSPKINTTSKEVEMLNDLKRRSRLLITQTYSSDWEWLVYAQHFGLKTRLLDWTSNPLVGLWFACSNLYKINQNSYVYILKADKEALVDLTKNESPFTNGSTKILRPTLNNERIIAQNGWFTAHKFFLKKDKFVDFKTNLEFKKAIEIIEISSSSKTEILKKLSLFGINNRTIYPDVAGLCNHLNYKYNI